LNVNGVVKARDIGVEENNRPDYVFDSGYYLMPLPLVAAYIQANKHLPDLPAADTVLKNGLGQAVFTKEGGRACPACH
jgi:hypothetical protein